MELKIGKINKTIVGEYKCVITSQISYSNEQFEVFYEYGKDYFKYVVDDRADAFLVGILPYAMLKAKNDKNLTIVTDNPITKELYHQLTYYYIPSVSKNVGCYFSVNIKENICDGIKECAGAIGTGVSGGRGFNIYDCQICMRRV